MGKYHAECYWLNRFIVLYFLDDCLVGASPERELVLAEPFFLPGYPQTSSDVLDAGRVGFHLLNDVQIDKGTKPPTLEPAPGSAHAQHPNKTIAGQAGRNCRKLSSL